MKRLIIAALILSGTSFGQSQDAILWTGLGLKADIGKNLSLKYETQARFKQNASQLSNYYNEIVADYRIVKGFDLGLGYRYSRRNRISHYNGSNRISLNAKYGLKIAKTGLRFKTRARYQYTFDRLSVINDIIYPDIRNLFRMKFTLQYRNKDFKRVQPFVGYELFKAIQPTGVTGLDTYRLAAGIDFDLPGRHELNVKYIYEYNNRNEPNIEHIYLLQYNYRLSSKLFKKGGR